jgi:L-fuconolactonase
MKFIDAHVHFWDRAKLAYSWLEPLKSIAAAHLPTDLHREAGASVPEQLVFVQAGSDGTQGLAEAKWVEALASTEPRIGAIVAYAPMDAGAATTEAIARLLTVPLVRGVRHNIENESDPAYATREAFIAGVRHLGERGLSFDHCCKHYQLPAAIEMARRCSQTQVILDHGGKPDIRAGLIDPWRANITTLAKLPNVVCKFSGLVTEADHGRWQPAQLKPYVDHLLQTFGPSRLVFGSDWPVVKLASTYLRWLETAQALTASLTTAQRSAIFHDNARRVYRL